MHDIVEAELHRLYPAAKPDGGSRLNALYPGTSRLAVWDASGLWYVSATDPFLGNTVGRSSSAIAPPAWSWNG